MNKLFLYIRNKITVDKGNVLKIDNSVKIRNCKIKIRGKGNSLIVHSLCSLNGLNIEIRGENSTIEIGKCCVIGKNTYLSAKEGCSIKIGNNCMFSRNINIMTSDGHSIMSNNRRLNSAKSIEIGNHVWLADDVIVLKGTKICDNSVVGISSVITKSFDKTNVLIVGNPGKIIKTDINWKEEL